MVVKNTKIMKVLFVIPSKNGFSGAALAPIRLMFGLLEKGIEVFVVASEPPKEQMFYLDRLKEKKAKVFTMPSDESGKKYWKSLTKKGLEVLDENNIELVHAHLPKLVYFMGKEIKKRNKKIVMMLSGNPLYEVRNLGIMKRSLQKIIWNSCKKYVDIFCPVSNWLADEIKKQDNLSNLIPIQVAIDVEKFAEYKKNPREQLDIKNSDFVISTVARLTAVKNLDVLIKAFAKFLDKKNQNSLLAVFGEGELKEELENLAKKLKITNKVKFFGFQSNISELIRISDVFVLPSYYEPFGTSAAEAGVAEIPVIISDAGGGMKEYVIHSETGFQFKVGDSDELEIYLEKLFDDPQLKKDMGMKLSKRVIENYSPKFIAEKVIDVYQKIGIN